MKDKQQTDGIEHEDYVPSNDEGKEELDDGDSDDDCESIKLSERKAKYTWSQEDVGVLKVKKVLNNTEYWPRRKESKVIFNIHQKARSIWRREDRRSQRQMSR